MNDINMHLYIRLFLHMLCPKQNYCTIHGKKNCLDLAEDNAIMYIKKKCTFGKLTILDLVKKIHPG